jgi:hypothetical protein
MNWFVVFQEFQEFQELSAEEAIINRGYINLLRDMRPTWHATHVATTCLNIYKCSLTILTAWVSIAH